MVFKRNGIMYRINNLKDPLKFVGTMVQLSAAMDTGIQQHVCLDLLDKKQKHWILECRFLNGVVALNLWLDSNNLLRYSDARFCWDGSPANFKIAVSNLILHAQISRARNLPGISF